MVFQKRKPTTLEKLPKIKRGGSADRKEIEPKVEKAKPPLRRNLMKIR